MITFTWDPAKAKANLKKHGISFEEAQSVFYDDLAVQFLTKNTLQMKSALDAWHERRCKFAHCLSLRTQ